LKQSETTFFYIYGIAGSNKKTTLKARSIDPSCGHVFTLPYKDICAIVSKARTEQFDPEEENMIAHNAALQEVREVLGCTVLPLRFSTIVRSERDVLQILSEGYFEFRKKIQGFCAMVEVSVKVFCDIESLRKDLIKKLKPQDEQSILEDMKKQTYFLARTLLERISSISEDAKLYDIVFEDMILNASFLLKEENIRKFASEIKKFDHEFGTHLKIKCSGPYVPYSFVTSEKEGSELSSEK
jgi:hypothetical protein